uniref:Uncharacterized protein n=1 Tax=Anguilla anguilla TaxID=7936 RepID=A0A0E9Q5E8_ANGAN
MPAKHRYGEFARHIWSLVTVIITAQLYVAVLQCNLSPCHQYT